MTSYDNIVSAIQDYNSDFTIKQLYYDDLKRLVTTEEPKHQNKLLLLTRDQPVTPTVILSIVHDIAKHHMQQYLENILERAATNPLSYEELFDYLNKELRIFFDAAKTMQTWILDNPERFGLERIQHQTKSLCFIPKREH